MKTLYLIGGTMGVGKTAACQILKQRLPNAVFLDGDWCWDADPFLMTDETKHMVVSNILHTLNNFLHCSAYENIIFCWVMHRQEIINSLIAGLDTADCTVRTVSLVCAPAELEKRLRRDIASGLRQPDILELSRCRLPLYNKLNTQKIDVSDLTPDETAAIIAGAFGEDKA